MGQIERRLAPFWRGLNDHSSSWTEHQLVAVARGRPLPAADEIPVEDPSQNSPSSELEQNFSEQNLQNLTIPITSRTPSNNSDSSANPSPTQQNFSLPASSAGSALIRGRAKTLASLSTSARTAQQSDPQPRETNLPRDSQVNGQPVEAYLYKDASECPICFLYYPPYLNKTRCCNQAICSECFVQIKRPDPHPPEHTDPSSQPPAADDPSLDPEAALVSEPAACPFCVQPEFGVTFDPPPFRKGLVYTNQPSAQVGFSRSTALATSGSSSSLMPSNTQPLAPANRRRATSLPATAPTVITTDRVRPDWAAKLAGARAHAARRSAAATALHTAAYLMGNRNGSPDPRSFGGFGRRGRLRRGGDDDGQTSSSNLATLGLMSERPVTAGNHGPGQSGIGGGDDAAPSIIGPPRQSSRRNRIEDLEDMMMMEAIRLSLASEEDRRKREEKESKKEAKKKAKEEKKAEKAERAAHKSGMYSPSTNQSSGTLDSPQSVNFALDRNAKGKTVARETGPSPDTDMQLSKSVPHNNSTAESAQSHLERSRAQVLLSAENAQSLSPTAPHRPSHLRNLSNVSSSNSSLADRGPNSGGSYSSFEPSPNASGTQLSRLEGQDSMVAPVPPGEGAGLEPMFNFRSLAAMIDSDEKRSHSPVVEHSEFSNDGILNEDEGGSSFTTIQTPRAQGEEDHPLAANDQTISMAKSNDVIHEVTPEEEADRIEQVPDSVNTLISGQEGSKEHELRILEDTVPRVETGSV